MVSRPRLRSGWTLISLCLCLAGALTPASRTAFAALPVHILTTDLQPQTLAGFARYVRAAEVRIGEEERDPGHFLYFDSLPAAKRASVVESLKHGHVVVEQMTERDSSGQLITAPGGLIHYWLGIMFIPRISLARVLAAAEDYNQQKDDYRPEAVRSRVLSHHDHNFEIYLRLQETEVITITLDTWHDVHYARLDATHVSSRSYSTRIQEVRNAGDSGEYLMPVGHDGGFLWRIDSYWRFEARDGGVYVQCESISLTRDIPTGFGWLVGSFVTRIPRQTLETTLNQLRVAALKR